MNKLNDQVKINHHSETRNNLKWFRKFINKLMDSLILYRNNNNNFKNSKKINLMWNQIHKERLVQILIQQINIFDCQVDRIQIQNNKQIYNHIKLTSCNYYFILL